MKRSFSFVLALALGLTLAACGGTGDTAPAASPDATAESAAGTAAAEEETAAPAGEFYCIKKSYSTTPCFNTGEACYFLDAHIGYCLVTEIDYATAQQRVLCTVPGCTHDSDACPAYVPGDGRENSLFTAGDTVYVYHPLATMHYEGSWEDYYAEVVEPGWEEDLKASGVSEEELLTWYRARYKEQSAPAGVYAIEEKGAARRDVTFAQDFDQGTLTWCDGVALYGAETNKNSPSVGYRVALADGSVTTFPMQPYEWVAGAWEDRLLTCRLLTDTPLPDAEENWDAYQTVLQNAAVEYDWLDPATGERSKIREQAYDSTTATLGNGDFCGLWNGELYFEDRTPLEDGAYRINGYYTYDPATGQRQDLVAPLPNSSMYLRAPGTGCLPGSAEWQGRYLWFNGSSGNYGGDDLLWALDQQTGALTAVQQKVDGAPWPVHVQALTDDGRFLVNTAAESTAYALIDAEAFLQGSTDYTPVTAAS